VDRIGHGSDLGLLRRRRGVNRHHIDLKCGWDDDPDDAHYTDHTDHTDDAYAPHPAADPRFADGGNRRADL